MNMDDIKKPLQNVKQDLTNKVTGASTNLTNASDMVDKFAGGGIDKVEEKLDEFTKKADNVLGSLENFLKKF